jgi:uncharacterized protein (DUF58 family)
MPLVSQEIFKKIRHIQYQSTRLANDFLVGAYKSAFRGRGMEFEEVREYQPGDEYRAIDWNVTARMNRPYVKSFREERDMTVLLAVDISASTRFGSGQTSKREMIAEIAAVIAFSAIKNNDRVGLLLFSDMVEKYYPPRQGTRHVLQVIRELLVYEPQHRGTDLSAAFAFLGKVHQRSGICFLISDFIGAVEDSAAYAHAAALIAHKHDLICISVQDPAERELPHLGLTALSDLEAGSFQWVDTESHDLREQFKKSTEQAFNAHRALLKKIGADLIEIWTNQPYMPLLRQFFARRKKERR